MIKTGKWPVNQIDHINGKKKDNKWINLRDVINSKNLKDAKKNANNKSGVTGVFWEKRRLKWRAFAYDKKRSIHLGDYVDFSDAVAARKNAEKQYGYHANHGK